MTLPLNDTLNIYDYMMILTNQTYIKKDGNRPKKIWLESIKNKFFLLDLNENLTLNKTMEKEDAT
ncbi:hypothetical protein IEQ34_018752 [Dendrobium chrysotoxum]|uniref:Uncharacterized protein n=1 Tax=Dendrobium chrysotoxum TaxID=161865 RepID=A0AAV7G6U0_DENCH|nr:hypothetical protein IEQ34_018752 [Dendrobium chrysotoxum]